MARREQHREDLFAEAKAFVRRIELVALDQSAVVVGFRKDGGLSVYFGGDPVYHLDGMGRLRRAFHSGRLYRSQGPALAELVRVRTPDATLLQRRDLTIQETEVFLSQMVGRITNLVIQMKHALVKITRQTPQSDVAIWSDFEKAVVSMNDHRSPSALLAPRFKGKR